MEMQWIPYSTSKDFWTEFELLFHDTRKEEGYACIDVYYFLEYVILAYGKFYNLVSKIPLEVALNEMYQKNHSLLEDLLKNISQDKKTFNNSELEKFLQNFYIPTYFD